MSVSYSYGFAYGPFAGWACLNLLQSSGAVADLVLWALLRLQYKLFRSDVYSKVGWVAVGTFFLLSPIVRQIIIEIDVAATCNACSPMPAS